MALKDYGVVIHEFTCTSSGLKKGHTKLALGILCKMYGPDKIRSQLCEEIMRQVKESRKERGAGPKPFMQKYSSKYLVETDPHYLN